MKSKIFILLFWLNCLFADIIYGQIIYDSEYFRIIDTLFLKVDEYTKWNKDFVRCDDLSYKKFFSETKIDNIICTPEQQQYLDNGHDSIKAYYFSSHHISGNFRTVAIAKISGFSEMYLFTMNPGGEIIDFIMVSGYKWLWSKEVSSYSTLYHIMHYPIKRKCFVFHGSPKYQGLISLDTFSTKKTD